MLGGPNTSATRTTFSSVVWVTCGKWNGQNGEHVRPPHSETDRQAEADPSVTLRHEADAKAVERDVLPAVGLDECTDYGTEHCADDAACDEAQCPNGCLVAICNLSPANNDTQYADRHSNHEEANRSTFTRFRR